MQDIFSRTEGDVENEFEEDIQEVPKEGADVDSTVKVDYESYKPKIVGDEWILSETDLRE